VRATDSNPEGDGWDIFKNELRYLSLSQISERYMTNAIISQNRNATIGSKAHRPNRGVVKETSRGNRFDITRDDHFRVITKMAHKSHLPQINQKITSNSENFVPRINSHIPNS
jgi:hypothetical protein